MFSLTTIIYLGIAVNADIVSDKEPKETGDKLKTYLGHIVLLRRNTQVDVTTTAIIFNGVTYHWRTEQLITKDDVQILIYGNGKDILVMLGSDITVRIMRHRASRHNTRRTDYLGFYIDDGRGLSTKTGGLLGMLLHQYIHDSSHFEIKYLCCSIILRCFVFYGLDIIYDY